MTDSLCATIIEPVHGIQAEVDHTVAGQTTIAPHFPGTRASADVGYIQVKGLNGAIIGRYVLRLSAATGELKLVERKPVVPALFKNPESDPAPTDKK